MIKRISRIFILLPLLILLTGCGLFSYLTGDLPEDHELYAESSGQEKNARGKKEESKKEESKKGPLYQKGEVFASEASGSGEVVELQKDEIADVGSLDEALSLSESEIMESMRASEGRYYYERLTETQKRLYAELRHILLNRQEKIQISTLDKDELDHVFKFVINDYPDIFYVEGYTYVLYILGDVPDRILFSGTYTMDENRIRVYRDYINKYADEFLSALSSSGIDRSDDYQVIKFVYEYIINNTDYEKGSPYNQTVISVMVNGKSVCSGYSKTTQYLLNLCGIPATVVLGRVRDGEAHSWNLVNCNGAWYYVDTTWGDASYSRAEGYEESDLDPPVNYIYLNTTTEEIRKNHIFDDEELMMPCDSLQDYYFVREGSFFTSADPDQLAALFAKAYAEGAAYVPLKTSNEEVFRDIHDHLLEEQHIFDYVTEGRGSVSYVENKDFYYIVFYL